MWVGTIFFNSEHCADLTYQQTYPSAQVLGLASCIDVRIGNIFFKGISGGQKRRVSLGIELLKSPSIIFLDEPTSGLDSTSAYHVSLPNDITYWLAVVVTFTTNFFP